MTFLRELFRIEALALVASFAAVAAWKIARSVLTGDRRAMLRRSLGSGWAFVARAQLLAGSLFFALSYLASALHSTDASALPPVPGYALALLAGSQTAFVGMAAWRTWNRLSDFGKEGEK